MNGFSNQDNRGLPGPVSLACCWGKTKRASPDLTLEPPNLKLLILAAGTER